MGKVARSLIGSERKTAWAFSVTAVRSVALLFRTTKWAAVCTLPSVAHSEISEEGWIYVVTGGFRGEKGKSSKCFSYYQSRGGASSGLQKWAFPVVTAEWASHSSRWETAAWLLLMRSQFCKTKRNRQFPAHRCSGKWSREGCSSLLRRGKGGAWSWGSLLHHTSLAEQDEEKAVLPFSFMYL